MNKDLLINLRKRTLITIKIIVFYSRLSKWDILINQSDINNHFITVFEKIEFNTLRLQG
jgi:hypothetical protein